MYTNRHFITISIWAASKDAVSQPSTSPASLQSSFCWWKQGSILPLKCFKVVTTSSPLMWRMRNRHKNRCWCFIDCVYFLDLSNSIWCFLLHFYLSSKTNPPSPPPTPYSITSDLASSQCFWFSKTQGLETETLNIGQIFSLWSPPSRFPLEEDCFVFSLSYFLVAWWTGMQQAGNSMCISFQWQFLDVIKDVDPNSANMGQIPNMGGVWF